MYCDSTCSARQRALELQQILDAETAGGGVSGGIRLSVPTAGLLELAQLQEEEEGEEGEKTENDLLTLQEEVHTHTHTHTHTV